VPVNRHNERRGLFARTRFVSSRRNRQDPLRLRCLFLIRLGLLRLPTTPVLTLGHDRSPVRSRCGHRHNGDSLRWVLTRWPSKAIIVRLSGRRKERRYEVGNRLWRNGLPGPPHREASKWGWHSGPHCGTSPTTNSRRCRFRRGTRSCPTAWCRSCAPGQRWLLGQAATTGRLTMGSSLSGAMVSRLI